MEIRCGSESASGRANTGRRFVKVFREPAAHHCCNALSRLSSPNLAAIVDQCKPKGGKNTSKCMEQTLNPFQFLFLSGCILRELGVKRKASGLLNSTL